MYRILAALLLVAPVLAGCTDSADEGGDEVPTSAECLEQGLVLNESAEGGPTCEEPPFVIRDFEDPGHYCVVNERRDRVHAPDLVGNPWTLGQWWRYSLVLDGEELGTTQMIYYDDQDFDSNGRPQHYMVGVPEREEALRHAVESNNPMIGRVHRVLYSPHESGDHADMFHFPLCEGSTWSTVFYDETFELTATRSPVDVPGAGRDEEAFIISGSSSSGSTLELSYSPAAQWFTYIDLDRSTGETVDMQLTEVGTGYSGGAFFLRGQQEAMVVLNGSTPAPVLSGGLVEQTFTREDGDDGAYDTMGIAIEAGIHEGSGQAMLEILDPAGDAVWNTTFQATDGAAAVETLIEVPYAAGEWTARITGAAVGASTDVRAELLVVSIYDRSGEV